MLDEFFTEYLDRVFHPDYVAMLNSCRESLVAYEYVQCEADLYKAMPDVNELDLLSSKLLIEQCLRDGFKELFIKLGIRCFVDDVSRLDQLLRAVKALDESVAHADILTIITHDEYSLAEITEHLLGLVVIDPTFMDIMFEFELIESSNFINRLYDKHLACIQNNESAEPVDRPDQQYIERIKRFTTDYPDTIVAKKLASKNILIGQSLQHYLTENETDLLQFYPSHPQLVPIEFVGFAIFANVARHEVSGHVKTAINKLYGDLRFSTKTNILVDAIIQELEYGKLQ